MQEAVTQTHDWIKKMTEQLSSIKAGLASGGFAAAWGWFTDINIVGAAGIIGTAITLYFAWCRHLREQELHAEKLRLLREGKEIGDDD